MKFRFPFERVLSHRQTLENVARRDWIEAQSAVDRAQEELKKMYDDIEASRFRAAELENQGGARAPALSQIDDFINGQKIRIERLRQKIRELQFVAEEKHAALVQAAMDRKTIEKLKERRLESFKQAAKKHEQKVVDDLVVMRFHGSDDDSGVR